jgi:hypothetical protein
MRTRDARMVGGFTIGNVLGHERVVLGGQNALILGSHLV